MLMCLAFDAQNQSFGLSCFLSSFTPPSWRRHFHPLLSPHAFSFSSCLCSLLKSGRLISLLPSVTGHSFREGSPILHSPLTPFLPRSPLPLYIIPLSRDTASRLVVCSVIDPWVAVVTVWLQGMGELPAVCVCVCVVTASWPVHALIGLASHLRPKWIHNSALTSYSHTHTHSLLATPHPEQYLMLFNKLHAIWISLVFSNFKKSFTLLLCAFCSQTSSSTEIG